MEIYNLKGDCDGRDDGGDGDYGGGDYGRGGLKITGMKQGVKNLERVNIYVNEKLAFSLDVTQVVDFKLKIGKILSETEFEELKRASEFGKLYQRTLEWVLLRPRSIRETNDYLYKKIYEKKLDKNYIDLVIDKLRDKKYLDDFKFAEWYVENRFVKKGVSLKRLKMELFKKGVSKEIVEEVLAGSERNDVEEIKKIIAKKQNKYDEQKLIQYLCRQGFDYQLSRELVSESSLTSAEE